jgi:ribosomal protein L11 methylase PrmA
MSYLARLSTDAATAQRIMDALAETLDTEQAAAALVAEADGRWAVELTFAQRPDAASVRGLVAQAGGKRLADALAFSTVRERDWVEASLAGLRPVAAGRFVVHGAHDRHKIAPNRSAIEVEAALAFGTGHHATTRGCLIALDALVKRRCKRRLAANVSRGVMATRVPLAPPPLEKGRSPSPALGRARRVGIKRSARGAIPTRRARARRPPLFKGRWSKRHRRVLTRGRVVRLPCPSGEELTVALPRQERILDLGTGSGVLAIAAATALRSPVLASDIDATAADAARANVRGNRGAALVEVVRAAGLAAPRIRARAPYDLVLANILLAPLKQLAAPMARVLRPGARVILSGLLASQANAALAAYRAQGLVLERRIELDGWATLVMLRPGRRWPLAP